MIKRATEMTLIKRVIITLISLCLLVPAYLLLFHKEWSVISLANSFFMLALLFFMITAFIGVFVSGFFDNFQKNMKDTLRLRKNTEPKDYLKTSEIFSKQPTYWLAVAIGLLLISLLLLVFA